MRISTEVYRVALAGIRETVNVCNGFFLFFLGLRFGLVSRAVGIFGDFAGSAVRVFALGLFIVWRVIGRTAVLARRGIFTVCVRGFLSAEQ